MSTNGHGPAIQKYAALHADVELTACCDLDPEKAQRYQRTFGFAGSYTDWRLMLSQEKPDAVCLIVPVEATAGLAIAIMQMGFPLIMEKPPALTAARCAEMMEVARRTKQSNQVAFNRRYTPLMQKLRRELAAHGRIDSLRYDFFRVRRRDPDFSTTAIHGIDAVRFLCGSDFAQVAFHYHPIADTGRVNIYMEGTMQSGTVVSLAFCPMTGVNVERATVIVHDHTYYLHMPMLKGIDAGGRLLHLHKDTIISDETAGEEPMFISNGFYHENAAFFDALRAGVKPENDLATALQSVELAEYMRLRKAHYPEVAS
ncbi:MAG TPA: Gfo/Idh/MocA family oxidoreductase [Firmicutes bacterium]|nr:Gfo/Idh/MocA family oxidoreductase [Bacillota bacterium]